MLSKVIVLATLFFGFLIFLFFRSPEQALVSNRQSSKNTYKNSVKNYPQVNYHNEKFAYVFQKISPSSDLVLYDNLNSLVKGEAFFTKNQCKLLTSASFYDTNLRHIGLFQIYDKIISKSQNNSLFIGFLQKNDSGFSISRSYTSNPNIIFAIQSGPLLLENANVLPLKLRSDKSSRRIVFAIDEVGFGVILAIFDPEFQDNGPKLNDLAEIVSTISQKENLGLVSAINLDGGRHSLYKTNDIDIFETSPAGGFLCLR